MPTDDHHHHDHDDHDHDEGHHPAGGAVPSQRVRAVARTLAVDRFTAEATEAFDAAGVPSILLKGPALARWLYDDAAIRVYADCDLLVPPAQVEVAEEVLRGLGYTPGPLDSIPDDWERHARTWLRPDSSNVDLHRTFPGVGVGPDELWRVLSDSSETMPVGGRDVTVLCPPARAMLLVLHAAKDGRRVPKVRHDLGHALDRLPDDLWGEAAAIAATLGATPAFAAGLRSDVAGRAVADRLALPTEQTALVALRGAGAPPMAVGLDWFLNEPSTRRRLYVVARKVVPPPDYVRAWSPVARRGRVGLAAAYVWRPLWMLSRLPRAVLAVRRARAGSLDRG